MENSHTFTEIDKEKRIFEEYLRIGSFFEDLNETQFAMLLPLIRNAAFMRITLDDLADLINESGAVETYQNGEHQSGVKQSAALQSYNALIKNYATIIKTLFSWLPKGKGRSAQEEWRRARLSPDELKKEMANERKEKAKASAAWAEKLKSAYTGIYDKEEVTA